MKRSSTQRKRNFTFPKSLIGIFIGLILGVIMFWIFSEQEKSEQIAFIKDCGEVRPVEKPEAKAGEETEIESDKLKLKEKSV